MKQVWLTSTHQTSSLSSEHLPTTQEELNEMMSNMKKSGFDKEAIMQVFKERKAKLNQALEEYEKATEAAPTNPSWL